MSTLNPYTHVTPKPTTFNIFTEIQPIEIQAKSTTTTTNYLKNNFVNTLLRHAKNYSFQTIFKYQNLSPLSLNGVTSQNITKLVKKKVLLDFKKQNL